MSPAEIAARAKMAAFLAERKRAPRAFAEAIAAGDIRVAEKALTKAIELGVGHLAMRAAARLGGVPIVSQAWFLGRWIEDGELRDGSRDLDLLDAMRAMLPPYHGPSQRLYRGEGASNRRRRTYGPSWSLSREIAEDFAKAAAFYYQGGVVLEAMVPPEAIIASPHLVSNHFGEDEYLVDRRCLGRVAVIARYPPLAA